MAAATGLAQNIPLKRGDFADSVGIGGGRSPYLECHGRGVPGNRYGRWYEPHPRDKAPPMESAPTDVTRSRTGSAVSRGDVTDGMLWIEGSRFLM